MGCCFYDLCSPCRKIYSKQSAGDQSQSPWFNKHSLISRHRGQTREGAVEGSHRKPTARQEVVEGAEGRGGQLDPVSAHLSQAQPLSHLLGGGGDLATNHDNGLYMLLRVLPECQEPLLLKLQKKNVIMRLAREAQGCGVQEREKAYFLLVVSLGLRLAWLAGWLT